MLLSDYTRPPGFADALDEIPGTISRPHWFVGGPRTGSKLHDDTRPFPSGSGTLESARGVKIVGEMVIFE